MSLDISLDSARWQMNHITVWDFNSHFSRFWTHTSVEIQKSGS